LPPLQKVPPPPKRATFTEKFFTLLFFLILVISIAVKIYKADHAGISFDERANFRLFSGSLDQATHDFHTTNNHVLNSVFMYYAHKCFSFYEHFIRIPSLIAGIMFSLAAAYIVWKTISSPALRAAGLALISLVPWVFNYSFLARGYAFALAGIYLEIALALWLLEHKIKFVYCWIPIIFISLLNFLAFGAMLSSFQMVGAFNAVFILFCAAKIFRNQPSKWIAVVIHAAGIGLLSFLLIYGLYQHVYQDIIDNPVLKDIAKGWNGWPDFVGYMKRLIGGLVFKTGTGLGRGLYYFSLSFLLVGIGFHVYKLRDAVKKKAWREYLKTDDPGNFVLMTTVLTAIFLFLYSVVLVRSPGLLRNQVFFIPLVLLSGIIVLDRWGRRLQNLVTRRIVITMASVTIAAITLHNLPTCCYARPVSSISGPVLRKLKDLDPNKTWRIGFTRKKKNFRVSFYYYKQFDYKFEIVDYKYNLQKPKKYCDVVICDKSEQPAGVVCLAPDYFRKTTCSVILNQPPPRPRP